MKNLSKMSKITLVIAALWFFLLPLFFLPLISFNLDFAKRILVIFFSGIFLLLFAVKTILEKEFRFKYSLLSLILTLVALVFALSALYAPNKIDALFLASPIFCSVLIYLSLVNIINEKESQNILLSLSLISPVLLSLLVLLQEVNSRFQIFSAPVANKAQTLDQIILRTDFTPTGSFYGQLLLFLVYLPICVFLFQKTKNLVLKNIASIFLILLLLGSIFTVKNISAQGDPLDWSSSWKIGLTTWAGDTKEAFLGVGPGNFSKSYQLYKPGILNQGPYWNLTFNFGRSEVLTVMATAGLLGLLVTLLFFVKLAHLSIFKRNLFSFCLLFIALFYFFTPLNIFAWIFIITFLALIVPFFPEKEILVTTHETPKAYLPYLFSFCSGVVILLIFYLGARLALAEYYLTKSSFYKDAANVFTFQSKAVGLYPYAESYHQILSQTDLAIANALTRQKNLSDNDKNIALNHLQLSINEARYAVSLNPQKRENYEFLGDLYQLLAPGFKGAEDMAISEYSNALRFAPYNPGLYLKRGGMYLIKKSYDLAEKDFQTAISLKPDYTNALYNLAFVFEQKNDYPSSLAELKLVQKMLNPKSEDYKKVSEDIKRVTALENKTLEKTESPIPKSILPNLASPSAALTLPSPTLSPTPSSTPSSAPTVVTP